jgi:hypothetical protein
MKALFGLLTSLFLIQGILSAQIKIDVKNDSLEIIATALNYGDGFYSGDYERMSKAIHPDLNKVCPVIMPQTGRTILTYSTYSGLIEMTRARVGEVDESKRSIIVKVLRINNNVACVKLTSINFNDYLEMVKFENGWKIVNVLWTQGVDSPNYRSLDDSKSTQEKEAIERSVRDYIEGLYTSDVPRVEKVLHPEFRRITPMLLPQTNALMLQQDGASAILEAARAKLGALDSSKWNIRLVVLDNMDSLAFAELEIPSGWNYCQLAKIGGEWKIINILRKTNRISNK